MLQNSGNPLHGRVLVGAAAELVAEPEDLEVVVAFDPPPPTIWVRETDFEETVICEFEEVLDVMVLFDVRVDVSAVLCVVPVKYVISDPVGILVGIRLPVIVLPAFVKEKKTGVALEEEDEEESELELLLSALVLETELEMELLSSFCALAPMATRQRSHRLLGSILPSR
jgi:hypothetical protein